MFHILDKDNLFLTMNIFFLPFADLKYP
jgi:hypothetical protein